MSKSPMRRKKNSVPSFGYSAPALEKGMDIVELLSESDTGLLVSEIATRLKRGMSLGLKNRRWIFGPTHSLSRRCPRITHLYRKISCRW